MNTNQYTQKTLEALQAAQQLAVEYQHNALEPEHLLHALATQEQGLIPQLLQKLNVDAGSFSAAVAEKLSAMPRVSGSGRDPDKVYISQATDKVLSAAAREAKAMKDDYVSVEHVFLALLDEQTQNIIKLACTAMMAQNWAEDRVANGQAWEQFKELEAQGKLTIYRMPDEDIAKIQQVADEYYAEKCQSNPLFAKIYESQQAYIKSVSDWSEAASY
mgnify:CR=1 FL=1